MYNIQMEQNRNAINTQTHNNKNNSNRSNNNKKISFKPVEGKLFNETQKFIEVIRLKLICLSVLVFI